jgi:nucleotide-binding universal stress UspA family protein
MVLCRVNNVKEVDEMFKNILVPTDLTEKSLDSLDIALKMGSKKGFTVTLLHVIEMIEDTDSEDFRGFYEKLEKRAQKKMDEMVSHYGEKGGEINKEIVFGNRVAEIINYAHDNEIDLIVLSSHKIEKVDASQGWATISYKVGILSHCPVMMVK